MLLSQYNTYDVQVETTLQDVHQAFLGMPPPSRRARGRKRSASSVPSRVHCVHSTRWQLHACRPTLQFRDFLCSNRWPMDRPNPRCVDPELRWDAVKAVAPLPPVISTANHFQHQDSNVGNWWGVKLARVSVDPHITIFFRKVSGFGGALDVWLADSMPDNGAEWSNQPVQYKCLEWTGLENWETRRQSVKVGAPTSF